MSGSRNCATHTMPNAGVLGFLPACTFGCCWPGTSKVSARSGALCVAVQRFPVVAQFLRDRSHQKESPDHSSLSLIRGPLSREVHDAVFVWVLKLAREKGLLQREEVGVDSTTLEANAAMKSIVRRDTGGIGRPT